MILAGDVGGTKTHLALFAQENGRLMPTTHRRVASRDYPSVAAMLKEFLGSRAAKVTAACLGIAGPVVDGRCEATNLPWRVDAESVKQTLGLDRLVLLNDLAAMAYGIEVLPAGAFAKLSGAEAKPQAKGAIAVIAAGTGLGEAAMVWEGGRYLAAPSEGGHTDFGPRNDLEIDLLRYLAARFGHVSYERILSGPGKVNVYHFLKDTGRVEEPAWLAAELAAGDPSPLISEIALQGRSPLCAQALELFASIYGAEAGNLALKLLATGGVYVGGGIAPSILPLLQQGGFMKAFTDKGRLAPLLSRIPVHVILEEKVALYGAARCAAG